MKYLFIIVCLLSTIAVNAQVFNSSAGGTINYSNSVYTNFPINVTGLNPSNINTSTFGLEAVVINIVHSNVSDLRIKLISPSGLTTNLSLNNGGTGNNFSNTFFTDTAITSITSGTAPFTGYFAPEAPLYTHNNGQVGNGTWTLSVRDGVQSNTGTVTAWKLIFGNHPSSPVHVDSTRLPIVVINTNGQTINQTAKITADMGIIYNGPGAMNHIIDPFNHYNGKIGIEVRGQTSASFPQLQYNVETRNIDSSNYNVSLLGMPIENDWVLYAPYNDKSLMRNVITYKLGRDMGHWAARTIYCEVVLNGEYMGVYSFMEKIKVDDNRVNIKKLNTTSNTPDSISGGYIIKIDKDAVHFSSPIQPNNNQSNQLIGYSYQYPDLTDISAQQKTYIQKFILDSFEQRLNSANFMDPILGYRSVTSVKTFVDYFIVNELSKNVDGYRLSTYLHKDRNGFGAQLKAGPLWDFNIAWHNADYCGGDAYTGWGYQFNNLCGTSNQIVPFWWDKLMTDSVFKNRLYCRWQELRASILDTTAFFSSIDSISGYLSDAQVRHFTKFPILGTYVWPNPAPFATSFAQEVRYMKNWIINRTNWLDANIQPVGICTTVGVDQISKIKVQVYPNPFSDKVSINIHFRNPDVYKFELYGIAGNKIKDLQQNVFDSDEYNLVFDFSGLQLSSGMYVLKVVGNNTIQTIKLAKQ